MNYKGFTLFYSKSPNFELIHFLESTFGPRPGSSLYINIFINLLNSSFFMKPIHYYLRKYI